MQFQFSHHYAMGPDDFWGQLFFDRDFNDALYLEGLGFEAVSVESETTTPDGDRDRVLKVTPRLAMPGPVKKLLGDRFSYHEHGHFEAARRAHTARIVLSRLADKVKIAHTMWLEPDASGGSTRKVTADVEVSIFGVGRVFEKFAEKSVRESYDKAAAFTNAWWAKHHG